MLIKPDDRLSDYVKGFGIYTTKASSENYYRPLPIGLPELFFLYTLPTKNVITGKINRIILAWDTKIMKVKLQPVSNGISEFISTFLCPDTAFDIFNLSVSELSNNNISLEHMFNTNILISELKETTEPLKKVSLIEKELDIIINKNNPTIDMIVKEAVNEIIENNTFNVTELSERFNCSVKTIRRRFIQKLGITPKDYMRIIRFNRAFRILDKNPDTDWFDIITTCNYHDKSHFVKDFKYFTNKTPEQLITKEKDYLLMDRIYLRIN
ncbi:MAG: AraC family transcriptional regulator [Chlorobi bacterium]|nr:AraC family transcriptional regulator [Chlorobiota bacterium]